LITKPKFAVKRNHSTRSSSEDINVNSQNKKKLKLLFLTQISHYYPTSISIGRAHFKKPHDVRRKIQLQLSILKMKHIEKLKFKPLTHGKKRSTLFQKKKKIPQKPDTD